jgi:predicted dehydrogenase
MSSNQPLRLGVIGLGYFGERHARIYRDLPQAELVAVCDKDGKRATGIGKHLGALPLTDAAELLARADIDAVSICLPDRLHTDVAIMAAEAGKAILLEKPLAHDYAHAKRIVAAVEGAGVRFMVAHILRFDPRYVQVHEAAAPERLGRPLHLRAKRNGVRATARRLGSASSILFYMGVHDVDAMQWVARSPIVRVYAQKISALGNGNEDALYAVVNFENGAIGQIDYSWAWPDGLMNGYRGIRGCGRARCRVSRRYRPGLRHRRCRGHDRRRHAFMARDQWPHCGRSCRRTLAFRQGYAERRGLRPAVPGGAGRNPGAGCTGTIGQFGAARGSAALNGLF